MPSLAHTVDLYEADTNNWPTLVRWADADVRPVDASRVDTTARQSRRQVHLDPQARDAVLDAYEAGDPVAAIAERFGVHRSTVTNIVRRAGATKPDRRAKFSADQQAQIVAAYQAGATTYELAQEYTCSHSTVDRLLERSGITRRGRHPRELS